MAFGVERACSRSGRWFGFTSISLRAFLVLLGFGLLSPQVSNAKTGHWFKHGPSVVQPPSDSNNQQSSDDLNLVWGPETFHGRIFKPHIQTQSLDLARGGISLLLKTVFLLISEFAQKSEALFRLFVESSKGLRPLRAYSLAFTRAMCGSIKI
ncbi:MAG: hypothetical protein H6624_18240 [Bdellovibrionaceae bacterium]|nr:hypothetical protein [Bdellovibrionales bacterium]MCB9086284.1 hypothetical protein [Pseudobdellovibrionaceae bacterium]